MDPKSIRDYVERDWGLFERLKAESDAESYRVGGSDWSFRVAEELRQHVRRVRPDWPTERERSADLDAHVEFARLLDRINRGLRR